MPVGCDTCTPRTLLTLAILDAGASTSPAWSVAVTVLAGGLEVTLVTWLRQR